jgi:CubicO group peptidase (beta-lactamase class C family)
MPQAAPKFDFSRARGVLSEAITAHAFPGCAFGVFAAGQVLAAEGLGRLTYETNSPAIRPETVYDVASLTKVVVTTALAMLLQRQGCLDLEQPLGDLLPGFVVGREPGSAARLVTLRHLLAHNSGLPAYVEFFRTAQTPAALFRACLELPLEAEPGIRAQYSDPGFILLGKALEVLKHEHLAPWARREILEPLGMNNTGFCPPQSARALIPPTEEDTTLRMRRIQGEVQDENAWFLKGAAGHAGLFSNVPDLLLFSAEVLAAALGDGCLFDASTIELFSQRQVPPTGCRALGWDMPSPNSSAGRHFSPHSIGHLGYSGCSLWIDLDARIAIILLTNRTWPDRKNQLIREIRPAFHDAVREELGSDGL